MNTLALSQDPWRFFPLSNLFRGWEIVLPVLTRVYTVIWPNFGSPKYFGKWRKQQGVHFFCEVLCGPWCTNWAQSGLNLFRIELTSLGSHLTMPWTPLNTMASCKRNFGSSNETLEVQTKHWKIQYIIIRADSIWRPPIHVAWVTELVIQNSQSWSAHHCQWCNAKTPTGCFSEASLQWGF
jgi:hypothetical protein